MQMKAPCFYPGHVAPIGHATNPGSVLLFERGIKLDFAAQQITALSRAGNRKILLHCQSNSAESGGR